MNAHTVVRVTYRVWSRSLAATVDCTSYVDIIQGMYTFKYTEKAGEAAVSWLPCTYIEINKWGNIIVSIKIGTSKCITSKINHKNLFKVKSANPQKFQPLKYSGYTVFNPLRHKFNKQNLASSCRALCQVAFLYMYIYSYKCATFL